MRIFSDVVGFEWDDDNRGKIFKKHGLQQAECEEIFQDDGRQFFPDIRHSAHEERYVIIGKTLNEKMLFVAFTVRANRFRIISARSINKKELKLYE